MHSKDLVINAVNHKTTNHVPVDFGSTAVTGMHVKCISGLRYHYGLLKRPVKVVDPYQMLGEIDEELFDIIGIDTIGIMPRKNMFGFPNNNWKEWQMPDGLVVLVPEKFITRKDNNDDIYIFPEGDTNAQPSAKMPKDGYFFDTIIRQEPIDDSNLDPKDNLEEFKEISDQDLAYFEHEVNKAALTGKAVVATFGGMAFGDIALVPAPFLKNPKGIRDIEEWYISTIARQDYIHQVFSKQCEIAIGNLKKIFDKIGNNIDVVFICGTDFGTQSSAFCSVETLENLYGPYYKQINNWIHKNTNWKTFKHSCGAVEQFIDTFIESGFDILNPVQCSAMGMEPENLKRKYGERITFWGGGVGTQNTLPFGTEKQVYEETTKRCEIFSKSGGFVFNTIHNIQANTPITNIVSMINAIHDFNGRS